MLIDVPAAVRTTLGVNGNYYTLAAEFVCCLADQLRTVNGCGVYRNLVCTFTEQLPEIIYSTDPAANCKWNEYVGCNFSHHIYYCVTLFTGGCNVKKYHFICSCCVVCFRNFHRISCILQVYEINTFHYSSIIYIQTGNNSLCKHNYASFPSFAKFSSIFRPYLLLFSGWNWQANMLSFSTEA